MNMYDPTPDQRAGWAEALDVLTPRQRAVMERFPFWMLWRWRATGQMVWVHTFDVDDDGRIVLRVVVSPRYNPVGSPTQVFGVEPDELEEVHHVAAVGQ